MCSATKPGRNKTGLGNVNRWQTVLAAYMPRHCLQPIYIYIYNWHIVVIYSNIKATLYTVSTEIN
uniref:Uncharacterized protein n=1 Tax=Anguilla anguilla TaxID=7936 RepID=A0A0E9Q252_ANGAN